MEIMCREGMVQLFWFIQAQRKVVFMLLNRKSNTLNKCITCSEFKC